MVIAHSVPPTRNRRKWALRLFPPAYVQPAITVPMVIAHSVPEPEQAHLLIRPVLMIASVV